MNTPKPARLLLVEDNATNQKVALMLLRHLGYSADLASNGLEALAAFHTSAYDAILMDCLMPEMDGLEASRRIRATGSSIPIIALTANAFPSDREACLAAGMSDYLSKPFRREQLDEKLKHWLSPPKSGHWLLNAPLAELMDDGEGELVVELLQIYLVEAAKHIESSREALTSTDFKTVGFHAHTLRGSSAAVGADAITDLAAELDAASESENLDKAQASLLALARQFSGVRVSIEKSLVGWCEQKTTC